MCQNIAMVALSNTSRIRHIQLQLIVLVFFLTLFFITISKATSEITTPNILILNAYHQGEDWSDNQIKGIRTKLSEAYPFLVPSIEHLDTKRFPDPKHLLFLKQYLKSKYQGKHFDLIMTLDNSALNLMLNFGDELFPGVPIVFAGVNGYRPEMLEGHTNITGVAEVQDMVGTLGLALKVHPLTKTVLAVHDYTSSGIAVHSDMAAAADQFKNRVTVEYTPEGTVNDLIAQLKALPQDAVVMLLTYVTDKNGRTLTREESTRVITSASPVPVYAMHETRLGYGIVGGMLLEGIEHGKQAADQALRILAGESISRIPVENSRSRPVFDQNVLDRFDISAKLLPADSIIINQPVSLWRQYRTLLISGGAIIAVLMMVTVLLSRTVMRMHTAEKSLRDALQLNKEIIDSAQEGVIVYDLDLRYRLWNPFMEKLSGVSAKAILGRQPLEVFPFLKETQLMEHLECALTGKTHEIIDFPFTLPESGLSGWTSDQSGPLRNANGDIIGVIATVRDITNRKKTEELLQNIIDSSADYIYVKDHRLRTILCNRTFAQAVGKNPQDLVGKTDIENGWLPEFVLGNPEKGIRGFEDDDKDALSGKAVHTIDESGNVGEKVRVFDTIKLPLRDKKGNITGMFGISRDITERKQVENEIIQHSKNLNVIFDSIPNVLALVNEDVRVEMLNHKGATLVGRSKENLSGDLCGNVFNCPNSLHGEGCGNNPECVPCPLRSRVVSTFETGEPHIEEEGQMTFLLNGHETVMDILISTSLLDISGNKMVLLSFTDVSYLNQALKELKLSEDKFSKAFQNSPLLMTISTIEDGRYLEVNDAFVQTTGYKRDVAIGSTSTELNFISKRVREKLALELKQNRRVHDFELNLTKADGSTIVCLYSGEIIEIEGKERLLSIAINITEDKKILELLQQAQKMESIGNLAGGIAHDFNNILFPIIGMSEMLLEDLPSGSGERENAEEIFRAGKRGSELVKQILAFSRQSVHKMMPIRIQNILKEVLKLTRSTIPTYIEIKQNIQQDCGMVMADPTQIHQIAMNIITNAYHAMEDEGGKLTVQLKQVALKNEDCAEKGLSPGNYALLSISDTGHGISKELISKIFEPYFTTKEQGKGTGLGLAVVYGIVKEHKGSIKVHSEIGEGVTFDVYLPLMDKPDSAEAIKQVEDYLGGNERILLVDDEEPIAKLEKQMLERLGYSVTIRFNSLDALEAFKNNPDHFDLVISDISMPVMPGDQLAKELIAIRSEIPIIICTGFSERLDSKKAESIGIKGFLMKPIIRAEMAKTVRRVLDEAKEES